MLSANVLMLASMLPPIQAALRRCRAAVTIMSVYFGHLAARVLISVSNLSVNPFINEVPPASTMLPYKFVRRSSSHISIDFDAICAKPSSSSPFRDGLKRISEAVMRFCKLTSTISPEGSS